MSDRIRVETESALKYAKTLSQKAQECREQADEANSICDSLINAWEGESGVEMQEKLREWSGKQKKIAENLENTVNRITTVVNDIIEKDRRAAQYNSSF